ncbi:hypothetical protein F5882DRAFT_463241 [Hyaloscypha sp. PMI_1271]|nr:hypothetical protein F5882DRAFT_463241 [Hyaloscypha sp. PMI_1271]
MVDNKGSATPSSISSDSSEYDTSFNRAIRNLNIPISLLSPTKKQPASELEYLTLRQELEKLSTRVTIGDSEKEKGGSLPDFKNSAYDFKKAGQNVPTPELFLEAIEMLLKGEPARRLDSTPRIRRLINNRASASGADIDTVKEWLMEEFPTSVDDVTKADVQSEIESLEQGTTEALAAYYQRTLGILRKTHGRDRPRDIEKASALSGLEITMLNYVVNAFVKGLVQNDLRKAALQKDATTCGALWKSYEMVQAAQRSLQLKKQVKDTLATKKRLAELEKFIFDHTGRTATIALAEAQQNPNAFQKAFTNKGNFQAVPQQPNSTVPNPTGQFRNPNPPYANPPQANSSQPRNNSQQIPFRPQGNPRSGQFQNRGNLPLPPTSQSSNPVINGTEVYDRQKRLYIGYRKYGHYKPGCNNPPLSY